MDDLTIAKQLSWHPSGYESEYGTESYVDMLVLVALDIPSPFGSNEEQLEIK